MDRVLSIVVPVSKISAAWSYVGVPAASAGPHAKKPDESKQFVVLQTLETPPVPTPYVRCIGVSFAGFSLVMVERSVYWVFPDFPFLVVTRSAPDDPALAP